MSYFLSLLIQLNVNNDAFVREKVHFHHYLYFISLHALLIENPISAPNKKKKKKQYLRFPKSIHGSEV